MAVLQQDQELLTTPSTVASLDRQAQALRIEVSRLQRTADELKSDPMVLQTHQVMEANEQLVLAALHSDHLAQTAVEHMDEVTRAAQRDVLTDTANRAFMLDQIEQAVVLAKSNSSRIAVLFIDLDDFKRINDTLGHAVGDEMLQAAAQRLQSVVRESDIVSRHGGDEFLILLTHIAQSADAGMIARKILTALAAPIQVGKELLSLSASVGIAIYPDHGGNASDLIHSADAAMYRSKRRAHGQFRFHDDPEATEHVNAALEHALSKPLPMASAPSVPTERRRQDIRIVLDNIDVLDAAHAESLRLTSMHIDDERRVQHASIAKQLGSPFISTRTAVNLLGQVRTDEPLLKLLVEKEIAHMSMTAYRSFDEHSSAGPFMRSETVKADEFVAFAADGIRYVVLEFVVTSHSGVRDRTRRELSERSFGLANGERVDCLSFKAFRIAASGVTLTRD